ncbi:MAG: MATE family efflux transporter [Nitriliruptorales bacterium]|nr:MATE family efflux transporter [Nitriliruptorales bacterium]
MTLNRRIVALAVPAGVTLIADPLLGIVDTAVVGRVGSVELGALGLSVGLLGSVSWIFNFLVYGTTATVSRAVGAGDLELAGRRVAHAVWLAVGLGLSAGLMFALLAGSIVDWTGADSSLRAPATSYLRIRALGVPFLLLSYVGHGAFRGVSNTRSPLVFVIIANLLNAGLDVLLVFGFDLGLEGAAWATVAAEVVVVLLFVLRGRSLGLSLRGHGLPAQADVRALLAIGRDLFLRTGALLLALLSVAVASARIGPVAAAAHQVLFSTWIFVSALLDGIAIAGQALVGTALGRGESAEAREVAGALLRWGAWSGVAVAGVLLPLGFVAPSALAEQQAVVELATSIWWFVAAAHVLSGVVFVLDGVLMGAGDFGWLRTWSVVAAALCIALVVVVRAFDGGLLWLWASLELMIAVRLVANVVRVRGGGWAVTGVTR